MLCPKGKEMKFYTATEQEIANIKEHGKFVIVKPLVKQPPEGYEFQYHEEGHTLFACKNPNGIWINELQYEIGTVIGIKGTDMHATVIGNSVEQVQKYANDGLLGVICRAKFIDWFNSKYAKPRYRKKTDSYECWCWDIEYAYRHAATCKRKRQYPIWFDAIKKSWVYRDKPLTIHSNPYCEIVECEVK